MEVKVEKTGVYVEEWCVSKGGRVEVWVEDCVFGRAGGEGGGVEAGGGREGKAQNSVQAREGHTWWTLHRGLITVDQGIQH